LGEVPQWLVVLIASIVPMVAIIGFWMNISSRLTKAETAVDEAEKANQAVAALANEFAQYRERVAREYRPSEANLIEIENRLTASMGKLVDRLDRFLDKDSSR
jgi:hypothetical protein